MRLWNNRRNLMNAVQTRLWSREDNAKPRSIKMNFQCGIIGALLLSAALTGFTSASNILGVFITHSPSHVIIHLSIVRALVERGHNVTVITSMPLRDPNPGFRHIHLKDMEITKEYLDNMVNSIKNLPPHKMILKSFLAAKGLVEKYSNFVSDPDFISFIEEGNQFDLMLLGYMYNEFQLGLADHFKCPVVLSWMVQPIGHVSRLIGNPTFPSFVPPAPYMDRTGPMNFQDRLLSYCIDILERLLSLTFNFISERLYQKNYPPDRYPTLSDMRKNISLILTNHHFSEGPVRPLVPGLVEIGGIQIKDKQDPLPEDINDFLENSPQGAILFSMGSYVSEKQLGSEALTAIYKVFSSLPYNVIYKSDNETYEGNATNILFKKWLPQDDILAHKNVKLFVTHGGKGGITESVYHGVPMVALPMAGDQKANSKSMQSKGYGLMLEYTALTEESFRETILEVLESERYRTAVQGFSNVHRDRPLTARENAIFWIEYVIRHRGAPHMTSPLRQLNFMQEQSIDVVLVLLLAIYLTGVLVKALLWRLPRMLVKLWKNTRAKSKAD